MHRTRLITIQFDQTLHPQEIKRFRSAIIEATQRKSDLFHNHTASGSSIKRYPLIQYKTIDRKAAIVCLDNGTEDIHYLLQQQSLKLRIGQSTRAFNIDKINMQYFNFQTWQEQYRYHIRNWIPINQHNFKEYEALEKGSEAESKFLAQILQGHILGMAAGLHWFVEHQITVNIEEIKARTKLRFKNINFIGFRLVFNANVSLPNYIGLGKGTSLGYGIVRQLGNNNHRSDQSPKTIPQPLHS